VPLCQAAMTTRRTYDFQPLLSSSTSFPFPLLALPPPWLSFIFTYICLSPFHAVTSAFEHILPCAFLFMVLWPFSI